MGASLLSLFLFPIGWSWKAFFSLLFKSYLDILEILNSQPNQLCLLEERQTNQFYFIFTTDIFFNINYRTTRFANILDTWLLMATFGTRVYLIFCNYLMIVNCLLFSHDFIYFLPLINYIKVVVVGSNYLNL